MHDMNVQGAGGDPGEDWRGPDGRFGPGNPGKPKGARRHLTLLLEAILEDEAEAMTRQLVQLAGKGDVAALRMCLQRLVPSRRDVPVAFDLPEIATVADAERASSAVLAAVAAGELTPVEAQAVMRLLVAHRSIVETGDLDRRLTALEARAPA